MDSLRKLSLHLAFFFTLIIFIIPVTSQPQPQPQPQTCESYKFPNTSKTFVACKDLPFLDSSLHWNYHSSSSSVDVAFKKNKADPNGWIAWAINPTSRGMVGSQAFVAFQKSDGTMAAYTSPVTSYGTVLEEGVLSFEVHGVSASFDDGTMILYASFQLPAAASGNSTRTRTMVNHVWQEGFVSDDVLGSHDLSGPNLRSFGQIDFLTAEVSDHDDDATPQNSNMLLIRKVHGIMNGIGWGILMPIGAMMGRYLRRFGAPSSSTWFHLHRACQLLAYVAGTVGFSLGIYIANELSIALTTSLHASIGIAVFVSCTVQILVAIFLRPDKQHRNRIFWNVLHYVVGYGVIILAIFNMFRGFSSSSASSNSNPWIRNAYFGVIISLGCVALSLEMLTWVLAFRRSIHKTKEISGHGNVSHNDII